MRSWFCLFRDVDVDGSGAIAFDELRAMVRGELRVRESALSEARSVRYVWHVERLEAEIAARGGG